MKSLDASTPSGAGSLASSRRRRLRIRIGRWLLIALAVLVGLVGTGMLYQAIATALDRRSFTPPGQMVDLGGYRMHLPCTGAGAPTVVLESGAGAPTSVWAWVQPAVAQQTRVCSYDRAAILRRAVRGMFAEQTGRRRGIVLIEAQHPDTTFRLPRPAVQRKTRTQISLLIARRVRHVACSKWLQRTRSRRGQAAMNMTRLDRHRHRNQANFQRSRRTASAARLTGWQPPPDGFSATRTDGPRLESYPRTSRE